PTPTRSWPPPRPISPRSTSCSPSAAGCTPSRALDGAPTLPLWGGVRGGGNPSSRSGRIPPSLSLPHKGGGKSSVSARAVHAIQSRKVRQWPATAGAASAHAATIADQFTRQAAQFAASPVHHNQAALDLLVGAARPHSDDVSLDVACGPGSVVCAF